MASDEVRVAEYYDQAVALPEARGGGLIWFLCQDHLSPPLTNEDDVVLDITRWRSAITERVLGLAETMGIGAGDRVLDMGAGIGGPGRDVVAHTDCTLSGVSLSVEQIENLRRLSIERGSPYVDVRQADMQALPMPDESFDHAFSINAIYHAQDPERVISEAYRVLRPGGRLGVDDWFATAATDPITYRQLRWNWMADFGFHRFDEFVACMKETGFRIEDVVDFTPAGGAFLTEERFGAVYDEQATARLIQGFGQNYPDHGYEHALQAVKDLRRDILFMGELYRSGQAVYRQIIATKPASQR